MMQRVREAIDWLVGVLLFSRVRALAQREAAAVQGEVIASQTEGFKTAMDAMRMAKEQASDDPSEQALLEAYREGVLGVVKLSREMLADGQGMTPEGRAEALARPSVAFDASTMSSPGGPASKAIEHRAAAGVPSPPPAKKRGRPSNAELARRKAEAANGRGPHPGDA